MPVPVSSGTIPDVNRKPNQSKPEPHPEPKPETLVPLPDATPLLGLHYDTARKRLQAGTLRGEKHGGRWLVWVPGLGGAESKSETVSDFIPDVIPEDPEPIPDAKPEDSGPVPDQTGRASESTFFTESVKNPGALVLQLQEEVRFLRQQVERQNHLLAGLIQRLPELPAGQDASAAPPATPQPTERVEPVPTEVRPRRDPSGPIGPPAWRATSTAGGRRVPWWKFWERWG